MNNVSKCKSCNQNIYWVKMESGELMPVDADSVTKLVVLSGDRKQGAIRDITVSHLESCPNAKQHRKTK